MIFGISPRPGGWVRIKLTQLELSLATDQVKLAQVKSETFWAQHFSLTKFFVDPNFVGHEILY